MGQLKTLFMKSFFLILILATGLQGFSQQPEIGIDTIQWFKNIPNNLLEPVKLNLVQVYPQAKLSHTLPNGSSVYILPHDNMPCIVPDPLLYNYNMPVVKGKIEGMIPNAAPPVRVIPKKKQ